MDPSFILLLDSEEPLLDYFSRVESESESVELQYTPVPRYRPGNKIVTAHALPANLDFVFSFMKYSGSSDDNIVFLDTVPSDMYNYLKSKTYKIVYYSNYNRQYEYRDFKTPDQLKTNYSSFAHSPDIVHTTPEYIEFILTVLNKGGSVYIRYPEMSESLLLQCYKLSGLFKMCCFVSLLATYPDPDVYLLARGYNGYTESPVPSDSSLVSPAFNDYVKTNLAAMSRARTLNKVYKSGLCHVLTQWGLNNSVTTDLTPWNTVDYQNELPEDNGIGTILNVLNKVPTIVVEQDEFIRRVHSNDLESFDSLDFEIVGTLTPDTQLTKWYANACIAVYGLTKSTHYKDCLGKLLFKVFNLTYNPETKQVSQTNFADFRDRDVSKNYVDLLVELVKDGTIGYPYKKYYINPVELFQNLKQYQPVFDSMKSNYWVNPQIPGYKQSTITVLVGGTYESIDVLSDYFIESERIKCRFGDNPTPEEYWMTNSLLVFQEIRILNTKYLRDFIWTKVKECTNFKPTLALTLQKKYSATRVLDFSAGWGDRLLGAMANPDVVRYLGFDPNTNLQKGHNEMIAMFGHPDKHEVRYQPFESVSTNELEGQFDFVLTSPPYFDLELYTGESQSVASFPSFSGWLKNFLLVAIDKCWSALIPGGTLCIHITDLPGKKIVEPMNKHIVNLGGEYIETFGSLGLVENKIRPVWIWRKPVKELVVGRASVRVAVDSSKVDDSNKMEGTESSLSLELGVHQKQLQDPSSMQVFAAPVRILADDAPQAQYRSREHELKTVRHWGQRKLLMSEIEFLTLFSQLDTPQTLVYAGSAPGTHIKYLSELFPSITFVLIDPAPFTVKATDRIIIRNEYFTNEIAREYGPQTVLFVSDIRRSDQELMIMEDMEWQMDWVLVMQPDAAMLKFRLPYEQPKEKSKGVVHETGYTDYLDGDIYLPVWGPQTTTESRLIVPDWTKAKRYDNKKYESQMFYFNTVTRVQYYEHSVVFKDPKHQYDHCYDCASEILILGNYLKKFRGVESGELNSNIAKESVKISEMISHGKDSILEPTKFFDHERQRVDHKKNLAPETESKPDLVTIRAITPEDREDWKILTTNPSIMKYIADGKVWDESKLDRAYEFLGKDDWYQRAITVNNGTDGTSRMIGYVAIHPMDLLEGNFVTYYVGESRKGYGRVGVQAALDEYLGLHPGCVKALIHKDNVISKKFAESLGFKLIGESLVKRKKYGLYEYC